MNSVQIAHFSSILKRKIRLPFCSDKGVRFLGILSYDMGLLYRQGVQIDFTEGVAGEAFDLYPLFGYLMGIEAFTG